MTDFSTLLYTSTSEIPNPFRAEPPRTGHYREYPAPSGYDPPSPNIASLMRVWPGNICCWFSSPLLEFSPSPLGFPSRHLYSGAPSE